MPELIWYKRFPQDWMSDPKLGKCSPASRGIWADIIECAYLSNAPCIEGTISELARICRCSELEMTTAISELKKYAVGEFELTQGQHKIGCRRMLREFTIKEMRSKAGRISANKRATNGQHPPLSDDPTPSASASEYASDSASVSESTYSPECRVALHFLNQESGRSFREVDSNLSVIQARLAESGVTIDGVRSMITRQVKRWKGTTQEEYLRPETLFGKTKFDSYYAARELPISNGDHKTGGSTNPRLVGVHKHPANDYAAAAKRKAGMVGQMAGTGHATAPPATGV